MRKGGIIMTPNKISGEKGNLQWLEIIKAIGPFLIVGTIIIGIWRFKVEREQEAASRYLNIIRELGTGSNSVRAGAVITMETYLKKHDKINEKYREQGIYVLTTHLAVEPTSLVRSTTEEVLINIGIIDEADTVIRKLACSNRHLWGQEKEDDPNLNEFAVIYEGDKVKVSKNLQSITNAMIEILRRRTNKSLIQNAPDKLDMSETYLMSGRNVVELKGVEFKNIELSDACMARMNLEKCTMDNCNLKGAHLDYAVLRGAKLSNVVLDEANLSGTRCEGANFSNTSLNNANLSLAVLQGADLESANLAGADLNGANLMTLMLFNVASNKFQGDLNEGVVTQGAIKGIAINPNIPNLAYYADWGQTVYRLDLNNSRSGPEFFGNVAGSKNPHLADVAFDVRIRR